MASNTPNYNFKKPSQNDNYNVQDQNDNMDKIDQNMKSISDVAESAAENIATHSAEDVTDAHRAENISLSSSNFSSSNLKGAMNELFQNVSDGKLEIATAIADKGGSASGSDAFSELASQINNVAKWDDSLISENIRDGINIFGISGSLLEGKKFATGNVTTNNQSSITVSSLGFVPQLVIAKHYHNTTLGHEISIGCNIGVDLNVHYDVHGSPSPANFSPSSLSGGRFSIKVHQISLTRRWDWLAIGE